MTERTWSQSPDEAGEPLAPIILAQAEEATELAPTGPLEPTGPLDPTEAEPAVTLPAELVDVEAALAESDPVALPEAPTEQIEVAPLAAGERRVIDVPPGGLVSLDDPAFDPAVATYSVNGNDLVVTLANGGVLVLTGFFAPSEVPVLLSVLDGPPTAAETLLAQAELVPEVEPAAPPPEEAEPAAGPLGGAGAFRAYDQGTIGEGLDPLGPLGPTELFFAVDFPEPDPIVFIDDDDDDNGIVTPPETAAPQVALRSSIEATIGEQSGPGFNPVTTPVLPIRGDGLRIPDAEINGVDQRNLTLDGLDREVFVRFINETSRSIDSLFVHELNEAGEIVGVKLVFGGVNKPNDPHAHLLETPLGKEFSLGVIPADTKLGFFLVNDGFRLNDSAIFESGRYELVNTKTNATARITDSPGDLVLIHIAEDGTRTEVAGRRFYSADPEPGVPGDNPLNPDGKARFVSGWDDKEGLLVLGIEDGETPRPPTSPFFTSGLDYDYDDLVVGVRFSSPLEKVLVIKGGAGLDAVITDEDSESMVAATITLAGLEGDRLVIDDAVLAGTDIELNQVSATRIELTGLSSIENYEAVISAATIEIDLEAARLGDRTISVTVEDPDGNTGSATTTFTVDDNLIAGTDGPDNIDGTSVTDPDSDGRDVISGRGGDDRIDGRSGDDFIDGGDGKDTIIVGGPGDNILSGGPQPDQINLSTGPGVDLVRITGLSDGKDTIRNFNATEGDRLDLSLLFRDSDIDPGNLDQFLQTTQHGKDFLVQVDLDGPGTNHRFVDIARLVDPTGVTAATDPSTFVITSDNDAQVA